MPATEPGDEIAFHIDMCALNIGYNLFTVLFRAILNQAVFTTQGIEGCY